MSADNKASALGVIDAYERGEYGPEPDPQVTAAARVAVEALVARGLDEEVVELTLPGKGAVSGFISEISIFPWGEGAPASPVKTPACVTFGVPVLGLREKAIWPGMRLEKEGVEVRVLAVARGWAMAQRGEERPEVICPRGWMWRREPEIAVSWQPEEGGPGLLLGLVECGVKWKQTFKRCCGELPPGAAGRMLRRVMERLEAQDLRVSGPYIQGLELVERRRLEGERWLG